ncbi:MAG: Kae1-associated serine/threonine protein kinase, partial [Candidatus Lokiarchaeota archaeon]|nr:Kae1-associated serine/threonine protein kinase [Candidatus Lokiarchaeota archaeon]
RVKKDYRVIELDKTLRVTRTVREANLLRNAKRAGVPTPIVYEIDKHETSLIMEFIEGRRLKEVLDTIDPEKRKVLSRQIGILIGRLHKHNLIHGDLTTSNMILTETGKIYLIDFGLGYNSTSVEDKAVDLHLLKRALESTHYKFVEEIFREIIKGYREEASSVLTKEVHDRMKSIRKRGRYLRMSGGG